MSRLIRNTGHRVGRAIRTAGRRYVLPVSGMTAANDDASPVLVGGDDLEMMSKYDPNLVGYYVW